MRPELRAGHVPRRRSLSSRLNISLLLEMRKRSWSSWDEILEYPAEWVEPLESSQKNSMGSTKAVEELIEDEYLQSVQEVEECRSGGTMITTKLRRGVLEIGPTMSRLRSATFSSCCFDRLTLMQCPCGVVVKREAYGTHHRMRHPGSAGLHSPSTSTVSSPVKDWKILKSDDSSHKMRLVRVSSTTGTPSIGSTSSIRIDMPALTPSPSSSSPSSRATSVDRKSSHARPTQGTSSGEPAAPMVSPRDRRAERREEIRQTRPIPATRRTTGLVRGMGATQWRDSQIRVRVAPPPAPPPSPPPDVITLSPSPPPSTPSDRIPPPASAPPLSSPSHQPVFMHPSKRMEWKSEGKSVPRGSKSEGKSVPRGSKSGQRPTIVIVLPPRHPRAGQQIVLPPGTTFRTLPLTHSPSSSNGPLAHRISHHPLPPSNHSRLSEMYNSKGERVSSQHQMPVLRAQLFGTPSSSSHVSSSTVDSPSSLPSSSSALYDTQTSDDSNDAVIREEIEEDDDDMPVLECHSTFDEDRQEVEQLEQTEEMDTLDPCDSSTEPSTKPSSSGISHR